MFKKIARCSKCDFRNLGTIWDRSRWPKKCWSKKKSSKKSKKIVEKIEKYFSRPKKIRKKNFGKVNEKWKFRKFEHFSTICLDFFRRFFFDQNFLGHLLRSQIAPRFQKSHLENCAMSPELIFRPVTIFFAILDGILHIGSHLVKSSVLQCHVSLADAEGRVSKD